MTYLVQTAPEAVFMMRPGPVRCDRPADKRRPDRNPQTPEGLKVLVQALAGRI
ncbi:hypothetical protein [Novosphingobium rosa]|uniref:hypothetical protein n=1 Tax=Novosphingobium rosa TaxID=76978 RepID=UPI000AE368AF|nr:hypothetical protein [Novosphingobium rosa]